MTSSSDHVPPNDREPWFPAPGDRVRHAFADLSGVVDRTHDEYVKVKWDYYGLAVAALGMQADLVRISMLERAEAENSQERPA